MLKTLVLSGSKNIIEAGRFVPSSRMCQKCAYIFNMELSERTQTCSKCNTTHVWKLNAAINKEISVFTDSGESLNTKAIISGIVVHMS
ncbi:MAG: hypothetical protein ACYCPR_05100 [Thermoplasmataceae archaeon]